VEDNGAGEQHWRPDIGGGVHSDAARAVAAALRLYDSVVATNVIGCCRFVFRGVRDEVESGVGVTPWSGLERKGVLTMWTSSFLMPLYLPLVIYSVSAAARKEYN
jgi:hypothetical protein